MLVPIHFLKPEKDTVVSIQQAKCNDLSETLAQGQ